MKIFRLILFAIILFFVIFLAKDCDADVYAPADSLVLTVGCLDTLFLSIADPDSIWFKWFRDVGGQTAVGSTKVTSSLRTGFVRHKIKASDGSDNWGTYIAEAVVYKDGNTGIKTWTWTVKAEFDSVIDAIDAISAGPDTSEIKTMFQGNWDTDEDGKLSIEVLGTYVEFGAVLTEDVYTPQALDYDSTPTNDQIGEFLHPDVEYESSGWNGKKFWMVGTPPLASNENPQMLKGDDGRNWEWVCTIDSAIAGEAHMADPNLTWDSNQDTLWCFYIGLTNGPTLRKYSTDGENWSTRDTVGYNFGMSPVAVYDRDSAECRLYYTQEIGVGFERALYYRTGAWWGADFASSESTVCTIEPHIAGRVVWHINIMPIQGGYHGLFVYGDSGTAGAQSDLHFARSTDGITWTVSVDAILDQSTAATWDSGGAYQSAAIPLYKQGQMGYAVWYSAVGSPGAVWHIGYTELIFLVQPDIFELQVALDSLSDSTLTAITDANKPNFKATQVKLIPADSILIIGKLEDLHAYHGIFPDSGYQIMHPPDGSANKDSIQSFDKDGNLKASIIFKHFNTDAIIDTFVVKIW